MSLSSSQALLSPSVVMLPDTKEIIDAKIEKLRLEHLEHVIANIEAGWECVVLSKAEEEELEQAWEMMKAHARVWRWKRELRIIIQA